MKNLWKFLLANFDTFIAIVISIIAAIYGIFGGNQIVLLGGIAVTLGILAYGIIRDRSVRDTLEKNIQGLGELIKALPSAGGEITVLAAERSQLAHFYADQSKSAAAVDMITLTLLSAMENFGKDKFVQWILAGKKIRVLMLSPLSAAAKLRSREESVDVPAKIIKQIEELKSLHARAEKQLRGQDYTGSLEVRLFDDLPYFSYFHTDKVMVMGLYYGHIRGLQSEALLIDEKSSIHAKMRDHFVYLWNNSGKHSASNITLCSIAKGHIHFNHALLKSFQSPI